MAAKIKTNYVCSACGYEAPKWYGKCPECGAWNTFEEQVKSVPLSSKMPPKEHVKSAVVSQLHEISSDERQRYKTGLKELDRVLGGGVFPGSVILLSGDPGIGKSTILLQICQFLCQNLKILYVSGEESARQVKLRAVRLGVDSDNLYISSITDIAQVVQTIEQLSPDLVMVDSIQTMNLSTIQSSSGSVTQVRECTQQLIYVAKANDIPIFVVGHVNKDGAIAGPKVLEHMVDSVLYFEGERNLSYRILRAVKNRYGSTNEIGVFEMTESGLEEVQNPSMMLLSGRPTNVSGTCVACVIEGSRPIMAEVQALVTKTAFGNPRRTSTGFDFNRTALILAVLEKRGGYFFGNLDAYINVVGGLRLDEPAADLPVALALVSNLTDRVIAEDVVAFGEVGLAGEIRAVSRVQSRVNEAYRLGFHKIILPRASMKQLKTDDLPTDLELIGVSSLAQACAALKG
ncbi:DNA repair protein RadA [Merdimmobilis hominis]|uniref:DNA repair protein RadA n=1 Tax=uncultured Anaerotruncus sp. TaxID=905011 RepID=A0A6N2SA39_9FIRM|nr:DNA repair protein RadA [Merdimmobilis hominis]MCD4836288.1 DNA repair protein RadA [Merdimmobilis hominis]PWL62054.1 MAG: DNA repair protein RadA [Oscillospiraceae bacterium]